MLVTNHSTLPFVASLGELAETLRTHAVDREPALPPPAMVALYPTEKAVGIATAGPGLVAELSDIVTWSRSLQGPTGLWCRRANGTLLVFVEGRTNDDTKILVSGGGSYSECLDLLSLPVGKSQRVTIDAIEALAARLEAATSSEPATTTPTEQEHGTWAELARLIDFLDRHLTGLPIQLPTPLMLSFELDERSIQIRTGGPDLVLALSILLPWTYSLGDGSIVWARTSDEHSDDLLVIEVHSCLTGGIPVKVVAHVPYRDCVDVVDLAVGDTQSVSLATLDAVWDQIDPIDVNRYRRRAERRRRRTAGATKGKR